MVAIVVSISPESDGAERRLFRQQHLRRAGSVDHVVRFVGQLAVMDVARGEADRRLDGIARIFELVIILKIGLQTGVFRSHRGSSAR